jgi:hypothetical protein
MSPKRHPLQYVVAYLLWIVSTGLGYLILYLSRETFLVGLVVAGSAGELTSSEQFYQSLRMAAASHWSILFLGIFMIVLLVVFEHFYRTGVNSGILFRRFFLVTWIEAAVLLILHIVFVLLRSAFIPISWFTIAILAVEAVISVVFLLLWNHSRKVQSGLRI